MICASNSSLLPMDLFERFTPVFRMLKLLVLMKLIEFSRVNKTRVEINNNRDPKTIKIG